MDTINFQMLLSILTILISILAYLVSKKSIDISKEAMMISKRAEQRANIEYLDSIPSIDLLYFKPIKKVPKSTGVYLTMILLL